MSALPETYSAEERLYDLAVAARDTAEPLAWGAGIGYGGIVAIATHAWWLLPVVAPAVWWLLMRPYKRRVKTAGDAWHSSRQTALL